jgi:FkbM family methyltransferase
MSDNNAFIQRCGRYILRRFYFLLGQMRAKRLDIHFAHPNYIFVNHLSSNSIVVDVGCADDPDFSEFVINKYKCKSYGVDPTRKHFPSLDKVVQKYKGRFIHLPYAVTNMPGKLTFYESKVNASGSVKSDHVNVKNDDVVTYEVDAINIPQLKDMLGVKIDFLKLDLEGAEYELLENVTRDDFKNIDQVFVEFHHHCIDSRDFSDTKRIVAKVKALNFKAFTMDCHNYLFYR